MNTFILSSLFFVYVSGRAVIYIREYNIVQLVQLILSLHICR